MSGNFMPPCDVNFINGDTPDTVGIAGTENGQVTGVTRLFVNNLRQQILSAHDVQYAISYLDFGTTSERISQVNFTSATFPGVTVRKTLAYTEVSPGLFRLDSMSWSIV